MLEILHRDRGFVIVNKPAGMLVHPGRTPEPPEHIAMKVVRDQLGQRVETVHRLDRPTSGVLLFALDRQSEVHLREQFARHQVVKTYTAIVVGHTPSHWVSCHPLQKQASEPPRPAETAFVCQCHFDHESEPFSILTVTPRSGRFHQIRKHLALEGHPIVGDFLHGDPDRMTEYAKRLCATRLFLHARCLEFLHPDNGQEMSVFAPFPKAFRRWQRGAHPTIRA